MEESEFARLPVEMLAYIFDKLDVPSQKICRLVCEMWLAVVDEHVMDSHTALLTNNTLEYALQLKNRLKPRMLRTLKVRRFDLDMTGYPQSCSRSPLAFHPERIQIRVPESLSMDYATMRKNVDTILRVNPNIESLDLHLGIATKAFRRLDFPLRFENLTKLKVSLIGALELPRMNSFWKISAPHLQKIYLEEYITENINYTRDQTMMVLFQILASFKSSVKDVTMQHRWVENDRWCLIHPMLEFPHAEEVQRLMEDMKTLNLHRLHLNFYPRDGFQDYKPGIPLLTSQRELKELKVELHPDDRDLNMKSATTVAIRNSLGHLEHLTISFGGYGGRSWLLLSYVDEICFTLQNSKCLEFLDLTSFWVPNLVHPLPTSLKKLCLGLIRPRVMMEMSSQLKVLEIFQFSGFAFESDNDYQAASASILQFIKLPRLRILKWRLDGDLVSRLGQNSTISISSSHGETNYTKKFRYTTIEIKNRCW